MIYLSTIRNVDEALNRLIGVIWHLVVYPLPTKARALGCSLSDPISCSSATDVGHQLCAAGNKKAAQWRLD
jgi:hypothetical protein